MSQVVLDFLHIGRPVEPVRSMIGDPHWGWLGSEAAGGIGESAVVRVRVGPLRFLRKGARLTVTAPSADAEGVRITWSATGPRGLFPELVADLRASPAGADLTRLSLAGHYEPPLGAVGRHLDSLLLHRVADATIHAFLVRVAGALSGSSPMPHASIGGRMAEAR